MDEAKLSNFELRRRARAAREQEAAAKAQAQAAKEKALADALQRANYIHRGASLAMSNPVYKKAPRLAQAADYVAAVERVQALPHVRNLSDWRPIGKSPATLFRGLCNHLLAKYPVTQMLWSGFFLGQQWDALIAHVAGGGSLYDYIKTNPINIPLTRKMCHEAMVCTSEVNLLQAFRRAQVRASGGDNALFQAILGTSFGEEVLSKDLESFFQTYIDWLVLHPMLPRGEVQPIWDYIRNRQMEDNKFSLKGRSPLALQREVREWHRELAQNRIYRNTNLPTVFKVSGFKGVEFDRSRPKHKEVWRVFEILKAADLREEGKAMRHCVYAYGSYIANGSVSIWSMTKEDNEGNWRQLTIEVRNVSKQVVQARGVCNRMPTAVEANILAQWAGRNGLLVSPGRW